MTAKSIKLHTLIHDLDQNEYHSVPGTYSSSQFKDCLEDVELFFKKYIEKSIVREQVAAFDVGSYFHTGVLEPHKLENDCVVYPGSIRRGDKWESFKKKHAGKTIVSPKQVEQAEGLIRAVQDSPVAMSYIKRGKPEVSAFLELVVHRGDIYAPAAKARLDRDGWKSVNFQKSLWNQLRKEGVVLVVKTRADCLGDNFILDLKSTSGNAKSERQMRDKISYYSYDLSAALYLDVFEAVTGQPYKHFIWTFASKDHMNSRSYLASQANIHVGRAKYSKAILKIADGLSSNWTFDDCLGVLEPNTYELEYLQLSESDLV